MSDDLYNRLPTADELAKFDRRVVVAFATRCARRVQPIYHAKWPEAGLAYGFILERAIRVSHITDVAPSYAADAAADAAAASAAARATNRLYASCAADAAAAAATTAATAYDPDEVVAASACEAARVAASAANIDHFRSRQALIRLIADDIQTLRHRSTADPSNRSSTIKFGPLWGVTAIDFATDPRATSWDHQIISSLFKNIIPRLTVQFAARCVQRVHPLADLDPAADTTGIVYEIWQAEAVAWDMRDATPASTPRRSLNHLLRGELRGERSVSPRRRAVSCAVDRAALATQQAANSVTAESDCIVSTLLAADEAIEAARLADEVDREEFGDPSTAHTDSLLAGMWDDLTRLVPSSHRSPRGFGPREDYRPLWAFNEVTDLPTRIANLKKRFAPPPAPLILPRFPKLTEDQQRWIESYAGQLVGGPESVKAWFAMKIPDLGNKTPTQILKTGNVALLEMHIQSALHGDFG